MINAVSLCASLATLILFAFYFVGRIWSVRIRKNEVHETVTFLDDLPNEQERDALENRNLFYSCGNEALARIAFRQPVNWVRVCKTDEMDFSEQAVRADRVCHEIRNVRAGTCFFVETDLPEGVQQYWIEYERYDYSVARIFLLYSGLSGSMATITNQPLSLKAWIYYLVR